MSLDRVLVNGKPLKHIVFDVPLHTLALSHNDLCKTPKWPKRLVKTSPVARGLHAASKKKEKRVIAIPLLTPDPAVALKALLRCLARQGAACAYAVGPFLKSWTLFLEKRTRGGTENASVLLNDLGMHFGDLHAITTPEGQDMLKKLKKTTTLAVIDEYLSAQAPLPASVVIVIDRHRVAFVARMPHGKRIEAENITMEMI